MFSQYGYLLYQVERSKSPGELRAEDASRGEAAASLWRRWAKLTAALGTPYHRGRAYNRGRFPTGVVLPTEVTPPSRSVTAQLAGTTTK